MYGGFKKGNDISQNSGFVSQRRGVVVICIPITANTQAAALKELESGLPHADAVELRMDLIRDGDLKTLMDRCRLYPVPVKILVTNRKKESLPDEGRISLGHTPFCSSSDEDLMERQRIALLKEAVVFGADFVDIEMDVTESFRMELLSVIMNHGNRTRLIVSHHDFRKTPSVKELRKIFHECLRAGAGIVKIVTFANFQEDNLKILDLIPYARRKNHDIIAFCMGEKGRMSRMMAPFLGSMLSFTPLERGAESAPGQLIVEEMRQAMGIIGPEAERKQEKGLPVPPSPQVFALFGNPVNQSLSPLMHNAALNKMNINGRYVACCIKDLESAVNGVRGMDIRGVSVTIPFKVAVMAHLDEVDGDALKIGAVNTLVNANGKLKGYNTDWMGLVQSLEDVLDIKGKVFVILGAGGTARAAIFGILKKGGIPAVLNRNIERGEHLAQEWGCPFYPLNKVDQVSGDCLINTTPVGMIPETGKSPVGKVIPGNFRWVMDVIYHPLQTKLLRDAERSDCVTVSGLGMFVHQGAEQIRLWTGQEPPRAYMKQIVMEKLKGS
jgi:shikimate dehydrogenase/3-dehydroquinate dehydratase type I